MLKRETRKQALRAWNTFILSRESNTKIKRIIWTFVRLSFTSSTYFFLALVFVINLVQMICIVWSHCLTASVKNKPNKKNFSSFLSWNINSQTLSLHNHVSLVFSTLPKANSRSFVWNFQHIFCVWISVCFSLFLFLQISSRHSKSHCQVPRLCVLSFASSCRHRADDCVWVSLWLQNE